LNFKNKIKKNYNFVRRTINLGIVKTPNNKFWGNYENK
tara:strand:+ start:102 stop:215 length:114 start_codon:yes stop_codon:yes gene_type:complete